MKSAAALLTIVFVSLLGAYVAGDAIASYYRNGQVLLAVFSGAVSGCLLIAGIIHFTFGLPGIARSAARR